MFAHDRLPLRYLSHILVLIAVGSLLLTVGAPRVYAAPLCVNPGGTGGCYSTIQAAVTAAAPGNPITVAAGTYYEHNITIDKALSITGTGPNSTIVDGQGLGRVFGIPTPNSVYIAGATIRNGAVFGAGGGIYNAGNLTLERGEVYSNTAMSGGGIANIGTLNVSNSSFMGNTGTNQGSAIVNGTLAARMDLYNVAIGYNRTSGPTLVGGGIYLWSGSQATLRFVGVYANGWGYAPNETAHTGGGIYAGPGTTLTIDQSAIYSNTITGGNGAGIYSEGTMTLTNVTISANSGNGSNGGGIQNSGSGTALIVNSTIVSNTLTSAVEIGSGGGINNTNASGTSVQILNTIVSNNTAANLGPNCYGAVYSLGYNLENVNSCCLARTGDLPNTNPHLGPLLYDGPTRTHALLFGSPAIDAGTNVGCPSADQRGIPRPQGARCDIGAYEALLLYLPLVMR